MISPFFALLAFHALSIAAAAPSSTSASVPKATSAPISSTNIPTSDNEYNASTPPPTIFEKACRFFIPAYAAKWDYESAMRKQADLLAKYKITEDVQAITQKYEDYMKPIKKILYEGVGIMDTYGYNHNWDSKEIEDAEPVRERIGRMRSQNEIHWDINRLKKLGDDLKNRFKLGYHEQIHEAPWKSVWEPFTKPLDGMITRLKRKKPAFEAEMAAYIQAASNKIMQDVEALQKWAAPRDLPYKIYYKNSLFVEHLSSQIKWWTFKHLIGKPNADWIKWAKEKIKLGAERPVSESKIKDRKKGTIIKQEEAGQEFRLFLELLEHAIKNEYYTDDRTGNHRLQRSGTTVNIEYPPQTYVSKRTRFEQLSQDSRIIALDKYRKNIEWTQEGKQEVEFPLELLIKKTHDPRRPENDEFGISDMMKLAISHRHDQGVIDKVRTNQKSSATDVKDRAGTDARMLNNKAQLAAHVEALRSQGKLPNGSSKEPLGQ